jgi:putative endonuclease
MVREPVVPAEPAPACFKVRAGPSPVNITLKQPCVYVLASQKNGTLYVGVTSDLVKCVWQHKSGLAEEFTREYPVHTLVWYEAHETMESAIVREKNIKAWKRLWKLKLIEGSNLDWNNLYEQIV